MFDMERTAAAIILGFVMLFCIGFLTFLFIVIQANVSTAVAALVLCVICVVFWAAWHLVQQD